MPAVDGIPAEDLAGTDPLQGLLCRISQGDVDAFRDLYSATVRRLLGLALVIVRRPELAEEVVQDVYVQVWSLAGRFDPSRGAPLVWLFTMTHRRAVDVVRREQGSPERDFRHHRKTSALGQDSVEELILRRAQDEEILAGLSTISRAQSEAIALAYFDGQTYTEVAGTLNLSLPEVSPASGTDSAPAPVTGPRPEPNRIT